MKYVTHHRIKQRVKENLKDKYDEKFVDKTCDLIWTNFGIGKLIRRNRSKFSVFKLFTFYKK